MYSSIYAYPNIDVPILIAIAAALFIAAFIIVPFFLGRLFTIRKVKLVDPTNEEELLANAKSLKSAKVDGRTLVLTPAEGVSRVKLEIVAKGKFFLKQNKKVVINFGEEETASIDFARDFISLSISEISKDSKSVFMPNILSAAIIALCQLVAVSLICYLTVYSFEAFNVLYSVSITYHSDYKFAYLSCGFGVVIGLVSFFLNWLRMKKAQNPTFFESLKKVGGK